jgi:hypothetical protein
MLEEIYEQRPQAGLQLGEIRRYRRHHLHRVLQELRLHVAAVAVGLEQRQHTVGQIKGGGIEQLQLQLHAHGEGR